MRFFFLGFILVLCLADFGYPHPTRLGNSRMIIGKLVRLRRTIAESKAAREVEALHSMPQEEPDELILSPKEKEKEAAVPNNDGKILLLMIVPPEKVKEKEGQPRRKPMIKRKNKRKILGSIIAKPKASKCKCASELATKLEIDEASAKDLLTNSSMALYGSVACTKNLCPLMAKLSELLNAKIKFVSDVKPNIVCEDTTAIVTTTTACPSKDTKDTKDIKDTCPKDKDMSMGDRSRDLSMLESNDIAENTDHENQARVNQSETNE